MFDQDDKYGSSLFKVTGRTLTGMDEYRRSHPEFSLCGLNCSLCPRRWMEGSSRCCLPGGMTAAARVSTASPQMTCRSARCAKSVQGWKRSTRWTHKTVQYGSRPYRSAVNLRGSGQSGPYACPAEITGTDADRGAAPMDRAPITAGFRGSKCRTASLSIGPALLQGRSFGRFAG